MGVPIQDCYLTNGYLTAISLRHGFYSDYEDYIVFAHEIRDALSYLEERQDNEIVSQETCRQSA
jgi:hypothetical protein